MNPDKQAETEFNFLRQLKAEPPPESISRLKRRLRLAQLGKDMLSHNAWAFWTVLNAFLRVLLVRRPNRTENTP